MIRQSLPPPLQAVQTVLSAIVSLGRVLSEIAQHHFARSGKAFSLRSAQPTNTSYQREREGGSILGRP